MSNGTTNIGSLTASINPVQGLVSYVGEIKPYHTKILEVLVEYIHTDCIDVEFTEDWKLDLGMPSDFSKWGWDQETAESFFNCGFKNYQISDVDVANGYFVIDGDHAGDFEVGEMILTVIDEETTKEYTVSGTAVTSRSITVNAEGSPDRVSGTVYFTKVFVSEAIPPALGTGSPRILSTGVMFHSACYAYDSISNTYTFKVGIVWPSPRYVEKNHDCGGWGSIFQQAVGSPGHLPGNLGASNAIIGADSSFNYFEIDNTILPSGIVSWADVYTYLARITVSGSTNNDGDYTVFFSIPLTDSSPPTPNGILRVYTIENVPSDTVDGSLAARPWGYDEPIQCYDQGQSLEAEASLSEDAQITINDVSLDLVEGWDMHYWDIGALDGAFTYTVEFN
jgi:hypothetical protein